MATNGKGKIAVDIRDSVADWAPYLPQAAPEGAPNGSGGRVRGGIAGMCMVSWLAKLAPRSEPLHQYIHASG